MDRSNLRGAFLIAAAGLILGTWTQASAQDVPHLVVDPYWPKPLPNNWILGQIGGVAVDSHDHIWVYQRPRTLTDDERGATLNPPVSKCCAPAPSVLEFDQEDNLLQAWGGPGEGYDWPRSEHGIFVDSQDNVWLAGNDKDNDHQVLKFTHDGRFQMQIGKAGRTEGSNSQTYLGRPAMAVLDETANELYVADGYKNKRVIVFDATTGQYRRHWGAYGARPDDSDLGPYDPAAPPAKQFRNPVHCARISHDGLVYVCDRVNNRIQVFHKDGAFVTEFILEPATHSAGSVWDIAFSEDRVQKYLYVDDGTNNEIHVLSRATGEQVSSFGRPGRYAGEFHWVHAIAIDSQGNVYAGDVDTGKRVQKFVRRRD
jgi:DNA-binding beta-propeller fold protein YncE